MALGPRPLINPRHAIGSDACVLQSRFDAARHLGVVSVAIAMPNSIR
jgi:hypothetical protein